VFTPKKENSLIGPTWKSVVAMANMMNPFIINDDDDTSLGDTFISFLKVYINHQNLIYTLIGKLIFNLL